VTSPVERKTSRVEELRTTHGHTSGRPGAIEKVKRRPDSLNQRPKRRRVRRGTRKKSLEFRRRGQEMPKSTEEEGRQGKQEKVLNCQQTAREAGCAEATDDNALSTWAR